MEISQEGGIDVPGVPSSVPPLFPLSGEWFHRVPRVHCFRRSRHGHSFLYSFLARREHWEQWELDCTGTTSGFGAGGTDVEQSGTRIRGADRAQNEVTMNMSLQFPTSFMLVAALNP
jgi:hypothetical protein